LHLNARPTLAAPLYRPPDNLLHLIHKPLGAGQLATLQSIADHAYFIAQNGLADKGLVARTSSHHGIA
jgi:hypothetical protein